LGEPRLDRSEVGRVFRQAPVRHTGGVDRPAHRLAFVAAEASPWLGRILRRGGRYRAVLRGFPRWRTLARGGARPQRRHPETLDASDQALAVDRPIEPPSRLDAIGGVRQS
jgi:hypothetical protein